MKTLLSISNDLRHRKTSSESLTRAALARIADPLGEGTRVFIHVDHEGALAQARAADAAIARGDELGPLTGIPISVKDLFDVAGQVTRAGSVVMAGNPPAVRDAPAIEHLRRAGAVIIGRTNMVEFAFSGLGLNPHYGTPKNSWDRQVGRIPGGSSSGAGVAVIDGMCAASIGTDTGGSVRIPAALCGLVGFKPTASRVSLQGTIPLSSSLDSIGPLAPTVACCAMLDSILANAPLAGVLPRALADLRFLIPTTLVLDDLDPEVQTAFETAIARLRAAGANIEERAMPDFVPNQPAKATLATISSIEAYAWHRSFLATQESRYDPRISSRIRQAQDTSAADYIDRLAGRRAWIRSVEQQVSGYDAMLLPTVAIIAPPITPLVEHDALYWHANRMVLRNTSLINLLDGCALSIPCHEPGTAPVGLMVAGVHGQDAQVLAAGEEIEHALSGHP